ncbi:glycoside hydrolase family 2 protein [Ereboglobus luteus]|uniref:Beta-galactosidase n=1 Tax=Ereboglobus luteus TaxID=1796921 RepID=A0A2U8E4G5_9BACT|nr:sugar-binding domain-containing protein [Ereboglobus luteus]AWI09710.1 hypothetical protein CKA38_11005 [Ereboglobus luteus]
MKNIRTLLALSVLSLFVAAPAAFAARQTLIINRDWTFNYFPKEKPSALEIAAITSAAYDDSKWPAIALPHTWNTFETTGDQHLFIRSADEKTDTYWWFGWGWYRKHLAIDQSLSGKRIALEFDGVQKYSRLYVNGHFVGEHKGGYTSFSFDITPHVRFGADNLIVVQVNNRQSDAGYGLIPPATAGNFSVYGGIYREVRLVVTDRLHIPYQGNAWHEGGTFVTTPKVSEKSGEVRVRTWVKNDHDTPRTAKLVTTVVDAGGKKILAATATQTIAPGVIHEFDQNLGAVANPKLWSHETPYLYTVQSQVLDGDRAADTYASPLGFRWFEWSFSDNRLVLNGKKIWLRGINRHQEFPWVGDAMPKWMHDRDWRDIRHNMGLYFQRTAHYPNDPFMYDLSDRIGFIHMEELPNIKDIAFDRATQKQNAIEMIRRDRNHPSIVIWSMGNETDQPADSDWAYAEDTTRLIYMRRCDHGTQHAGNHIQITDKNIAIENLLRCTVRGWLNEDDHDFGVMTGRPDSSQVTGTEEWQHYRNRSSRDILNSNVVTWLYADHGCRREYLNSPVLNVNPKGWVDAYRFPKLTYYLWQANFSSTPMASIHPSYWRPKYIGQKHDILVDSNCDEVELLLDGKSLGKQKPSAADKHVVTFKNITVTRGTLTAVGVKKGKRVETTLAMSGEPARLVLTASHKAIPADRSGIAQVTADVVDAAGNHVYGANPPLTWRLTGAGKLVGPAQYTTDTHDIHSRSGLMYIDTPISNVVRSAAAPGDIRVTVSAPGLAPAEIIIKAVAPEAPAATGITEPALSDANRRPVARDPNFKTVVFAQKAQYIEEIRPDADFTPDASGGYRAQVTKFVADRNHGVDPFSSDYRAFVERMIQITTDRGGHLVADDWNFEARKINEKIGKPPSDKVKAAKQKAERKKKLKK